MIKSGNFLHLRKVSTYYLLSIVTKMEDLTFEEKCENLMNVVVQSRKKFGRMCTDYHQKASTVENKILNLQLETFNNYRFKSKNTVQDVNVDDMNKEIKDFTTEIVGRRKIVEALRKRVQETNEIVIQLKKDSLCKKMSEPLTAEAKLARAKERNVVKMDIA